MKRNLKFWTQFTWETAGVDLTIAGLICLVTVFGAEGLDLKLFVSVVPYFLCMAAILGMMMINTGAQYTYLPLLLSMGETRRNVLLGFRYYQALLIAAATAACAIIWLAVPGEVSSTGLRSLPTLVCILIITASFGSIIGTIFVKWKWAGTVLIILLCGGVGGLAGYSGVAASKGTLFSNTLSMVSYLEELPYWMILAALVSAGLDVLFQWLLLRRQEVKL